VDSLSDESGQALVFAILILGVSAAVVVGLRDVQERILDGVRDDRAGEAAVAAAGKVVADAVHARTRGGAQHLSVAATTEFAALPEVVESARSAAIVIARANGRPDPTEVSVHAYGYEIEVHLTLAGRRHIALLAPAP
jgi:hypothetical protein